MALFHVFSIQNVILVGHFDLVIRLSMIVVLEESAMGLLPLQTLDLLLMPSKTWMEGYVNLLLETNL